MQVGLLFQEKKFAHSTCWENVLKQNKLIINKNISFLIHIVLNLNNSKKQKDFQET
jgi:hypothetical protein